MTVTIDHWDATDHLRATAAEALLAEVATMTRAAINGDELVDVIEWHGHNDRPLVRDPTTHLGLIVLADSARIELRDTDAPGSLRFHGELRAEHAFLVPAQVANDYATAIWSTRTQAPSNGRYRYLAVEHLQGRSLLPGQLGSLA